MFLSAKANSLWSQVGQHTYTHPHLGHRLVCPCLCLFCRLETKSSATESVGAEHHYGNQHSGPGCGCSWISAETFFFFGNRSKPELIIESLLLNVLHGLANDLMCAVFFFLFFPLLKNRQIFSVIKTKMQL